MRGHSFVFSTFSYSPVYSYNKMLMKMMLRLLKVSVHQELRNLELIEALVRQSKQTSIHITDVKIKSY